ncbi:MAG: TonB-dependent receptor plug domain-containing protein [Bacteroidales bacterium]|nr:TonB-dependent receptor plug domain-containing protein [Bacteroidales bacterium]
MFNYKAILCRLLLLVALLCPARWLNAQVFSGIVVDTARRPVAGAAVVADGLNAGVATDADGRFALRIASSSGYSLRLVVSCLGFTPDTLMLDRNHTQPLLIVLSPALHDIGEVQVAAAYRRVDNIERISVRHLGQLPNVSGSFEELLKTLPGVSSSNELSSQYSVRGGNFDENLVYVNGIEIYRPLLIRSGQQEGLSFVNPDLVEAVNFSAGAFNAEYGDKISSVLDVRYRTPNRFATSLSVSLLGANLSVEGITPSQRVSYLMGLRYKTNRYLLASLDSKGDYTPSFIDLQGILGINLTPRLDLSLLGNLAINTYRFAPIMRSTEFGTMGSTLHFNVYYWGQEYDRSTVGMGAATLRYALDAGHSLSLTTAHYLTRESETFDLLGEYYLNDLDNELGSSAYTDSLINVGVGGFLNHARNYLYAQISTLGLRGEHPLALGRIDWGLTASRERISDELNEWERIDSSGYTLSPTPDAFSLSNVLRCSNALASTRLSAFAQHTGRFDLGALTLRTTVGLRASWWSYTAEPLISPRLAINLTPNGLRDLQLHLAAGLYHQPAFYKELRLPSGNLNPNIRAQRSAQVLLGLNYYFSAWERPFRLSAEAYYKHLSQLVPYRVDNVRIDYAGQNLARGYARGVDFKLNGQMVAGLESWLSLSFMRTMEDIQGDSYIDALSGQTQYPGYYRRPTDQRFALSLFFQDYLPGYETFRVHLTGAYGSGLPGTTATPERYDLTFDMPSYKRVDIGFTASLFNATDRQRSLIKRQLMNLSELEVSAEVFNLFNFSNTVSYLWVRAVGNQEGTSLGMYAVPNYLTLRRINLKLTLKF